MDIYKEVRLKCFEMSACDLAEIFGEKGTEANGDWSFDKNEKSKHVGHNESLGYSDKNTWKKSVDWRTPSLHCTR